MPVKFLAVEPQQPSVAHHLELVRPLEGRPGPGRKQRGERGASRKSRQTLFARPPRVQRRAVLTHPGPRTTSTQSLTRPRPATHRNRASTSTSSAVGVPRWPFRETTRSTAKQDGQDGRICIRAPKPRRTTCRRCPGGPGPPPARAHDSALLCITSCGLFSEMRPASVAEARRSKVDTGDG